MKPADPHQLEGTCVFQPRRDFARMENYAPLEPAVQAKTRQCALCTVAEVGHKSPWG